MKNGRYGSRDIDIGGAASTEQMLAALQVPELEKYVCVRACVRASVCVRVFENVGLLFL